MVLAFGLIVLGILLLAAGMTGRTLVQVVRREAGSGFILSDTSLPDIELQQSAASSTAPVSASSLTGAGTTAGGARGMVDYAAQIGAGFGLRVVSAHRPGDPLDHGSNDADRAARDLSNAKDALSGPPTPEMDAAVEAIAQAFGQRVNGKTAIVKTWHWRGYRLQLIYRTPAYGDHRGHIHFGVRKL